MNKIYISLKIIIFSFLLFTSSFFPAKAQDNVGIGTITPDPSSILDLSATDKGLLVPRMTAAQRLAMTVTPSSNSLLVYDIDSMCFFFYRAPTSVWISLCDVSTGPPGPIGPQGPAGADGADGAAGPTGPTGADGAAGPSGADGADGAAGPSGPAGADGVAGPTGPTGADGVAGPTGPAGADGADGAAGPAGPAGADGVDGATGPTGPAGPVGCATANTVIKSDGTSAVCSQIYDNGTNVGIGTTTPNTKLHVVGSIKMVDGNQGSNKIMTSDANGVASWQDLSQNTYGTNNQGVSGTTDITMNTNIFTDMSQMTITFTPVHNLVYVTFTFSAYGDPSVFPMEYVDFRILRNGTSMGGSNCLVEDYDDVDGIVTSFNGSISLAVPVTSGVLTTIKVQWRRDGLFTSEIYCNAATEPDYNHRSLIIID